MNIVMQQQFEEWARNHCMQLKKDGVVTTYAYERTDLAWQAWQASRESLAIDSQPAWHPMTEEPPFPFRGDIFADGKLIIGADWAGGGLTHGYWQSPKGDRSVELVTHWKQSNPEVTAPEA